MQPSDAPSRNPARRPKRCMNHEAGIRVIAVPTSVIATGSVAMLLAGRKLESPTTPEAVITTTEVVWASAWEPASIRTFRFSEDAMGAPR